MTASPESLAGIIAEHLGVRADATFDPTEDPGILSVHIDGKHFYLFIVEDNGTFGTYAVIGDPVEAPVYATDEQVEEAERFGQAQAAEFELGGEG